MQYAITNSFRDLLFLMSNGIVYTLYIVKKSKILPPKVVIVLNCATTMLPNTVTAKNIGHLFRLSCL